MWQLDYKEDWEWKNWCFWIEVLQKTLESSFDGKEIKPLSPKGNPEYSLEGLMLKLKVKYFGHLMRRADLMEKSLTPGKIEGKRRMGWQRMRWWDSITNSMNVNVSKLWETVKHWKPGMPQSMRSQSQTWLLGWMATIHMLFYLIITVPFQCFFPGNGEHYTFHFNRTQVFYSEVSRKFFPLKAAYVISVLVCFP